MCVFCGCCVFWWCCCCCCGCCEIMCFIWSSTILSLLSFFCSWTFFSLLSLLCTWHPSASQAIIEASLRIWAFPIEFHHSSLLAFLFCLQSLCLHWSVFRDGAPALPGASFSVLTSLLQLLFSPRIVDCRVFARLIFAVIICICKLHSES